MIGQYRAYHISSFKLLPAAASFVVIVIACLSLIGWVFNIGVFTRPEWPVMAPNAALCFILCGISLWLLRKPLAKRWGEEAPWWKNLFLALSRRRFAQLSALAAIVIALLTLAEYLFGWDPGIDGWLVGGRREFGGGDPSFPRELDDRMGPSTGIDLLLIGGALLLIDFEGRDESRPGQHMAAATMILSLLALLGYIYGTPHFYEIGPWPGMALHSAVSFIALSLGVLYARPEQGLMALLTSESTGGYMARRLLLTAILVPSALGWLCMMGQRAGYYNAGFGDALLVVGNILALMAVTWRYAVSLHDLDIERLRAEAALRNSHADLERRVREQTAELVRANQDLWTEIGERERVEEELRRSQGELEDFFENAPVGLHKIGPDGIVIWANNADYILLGYARDEYIGHPIADFYADRTTFEDIMARLRCGKSVENYEARLRAKDGSIRHVLVGSNVFWKDGQFIHTRCFTRDITERRQAEERLRESEGRFRLMADSSPVMIWMSGTDKLCDWFSQGWLDFTGRTMEQELGNGWADGVHPDDLEYCLETYITSFEARDEFKMEYRLRRYDGEYRWILNHGVPRFHHDGKFAGYIGCGIDIHERRQAEEALCVSEELNRRILDSSADCIKVLELDGRLISMNSPGMCMMEIDDLSRYAGTQWLDFWEGEAREAIVKAIKAARSGAVGRFIGLCKTMGGTPKWWDVVISPILDQRGVAERLVSISRDITESKRIEEERNQLLAREQAARAQAEDANRLKDEFLATVSHELRAPLNSIQGWVKLLREGRLGPDEAARALETVERSARSQNRIISDLLDVSRIITGKLRLNVRPIEPAIVIESAVEALRPAADAKEINLEMVLDDSAGPISGDSDRLRQIVWNLVSNAIKFTPKNGRVEVRLERINSSVEIVVSDSGAGISPEFLPFVFDRFRQGDSSSSRRQGGLGLGLAIVRHLTEMHGGSVRAESIGQSKGATFVVKLPLMVANKQAVESARVQPAGEPGRTPLESPPQLDGLRVLVVDDDPDARELVKTILTQCRAVVETAASAAEAISVITRHDGRQPDLLISDIEMPGADGYALIHKLREMEEQRGGHIPAVALTAYTRVEDRLRSFSSGFQMHVAKPIEPAELLTIVASLTGRLAKQRSLYRVNDGVASVIP